MKEYYKHECSSCSHSHRDCPKPHRKLDCSCILKKFHLLMEKAKQLYKASDKARMESLDEAYEALKKLEESIELNKKACYVENLADKMLKESNCKPCVKDPCNCKELKEKANHFHALECKEVLESIKLLKEVICKLQESNENDRKGDYFLDEYNKCIHKDKCPECDKYHRCEKCHNR